jgi:hypothetical protein
MYTDMRVDPASLGLPLFELDAYRVASQEARDSQHSLYRLPNLLYCLGQAGEMDGDLLRVNATAFRELAKIMRVKNLPPLVDRLSACGLELGGWNGRAFDKKIDAYAVAYPANPQMLAVLVAAAHKASSCHQGPKHRAGNHFYTMDHKLFRDEPGVAPRFDLSDFAHLAGDEAAPFLYAWHGYMTGKGYGHAIDDDFYRLEYLDARGKSTLDYFRCADYRYGDRQGLLLLRLKLNHVSLYNDVVEECPDPIKQGFRDAWKCGHCAEKCGRRVSYRIDGAYRESCICDAFAFFQPRLEDMAHYQRLFELEQEARRAKRTQPAARG